VGGPAATSDRTPRVFYADRAFASEKRSPIDALYR